MCLHMLIMESEDEIDSWYEENKQTLLDRYTEQLATEDRDKIAAEYHKKLTALMQDYQKKHHAFLMKDHKKQVTQKKKHNEDMFKDKPKIFSFIPFLNKKEPEKEE